MPSGSGTARPADAAPLELRDGWLRLVVIGGLVVALLDIANAMTFWYFYRGAGPVTILQSIAVGVLGKEAFNGGIPTACLGAALHLLIAFGVAGVYGIGCRVWPVLLRRPAICGAIYSVIVYLVMHQIVLPLSRVPPGPFLLPWFLDDFIGHVLLIGIPVALVARRVSLQRR